jgi:predicted HNH restriction endonuclease
VSDELKSLEAGEYTLVARLIDGTYRGALWHGGRVEQKFEGNSLDDVYRKLVTALVERQADRAAARKGTVPTVQETVHALSRILQKASHGQRAMLRAHVNAQDQRITATELAEAAGYANYGAANLHYGLLGAMLFTEMPEDLPRRSDGTPIMTCAIASGEDQRNDREEQWVWKMRPHIVEAIRQLGAI